MKFLRCLIMALLVVSIFVGSAIAGYSDPNKFWTRFRQAVLDNDVTTIADLTHFPFKTRGPLDSHPIVRYDKKSFPALYKRLIAQEEEILSSDKKFVTKSMLELIREKKTIVPKDYNTSDCLWIYAFKFELINRCWYFTWAYTDD